MCHNPTATRAEGAVISSERAILRPKMAHWPEIWTEDEWHTRPKLRGSPKG
jgi:hypothetical protein